MSSPDVMKDLTKRGYLVNETSTQGLGLTRWHSDKSCTPYRVMELDQGVRR